MHLQAQILFFFKRMYICHCYCTATCLIINYSAMIDLLGGCYDEKWKMTQMTFRNVVLLNWDEFSHC